MLIRTILFFFKYSGITELDTIIKQMLANKVMHIQTKKGKKAVVEQTTQYEMQL